MTYHDTCVLFQKLVFHIYGEAKNEPPSQFSSIASIPTRSHHLWSIPHFSWLYNHNETQFTPTRCVFASQMTDVGKEQSKL